MNIPRFLKTATLLLAVALLAACGSNSGSDSSTVTGPGTPSGISAGVAVDPYITGAVFQEISADGRTVLQRQSTISDSRGRFVFTRHLTPGSLVVMKPGSTGTHVGATFEGILKRKVETDDDGALVVSPLTTLLANGMTKADVITLLGDAGLTGLSEADLTADPMAGLAGQTGTISDASLEPLRASMAVNATLNILDNYDADDSDLDSYDGALLLERMAAATRDTLSSDVYDSIKQDLALDPAATSPLQMDDVIKASVELSRKVAARIKTGKKNNGDVLNIAIIDYAVQAELPALYDTVSNHYQSRVGGDPVPGTDPVPVDGQTVFSNDCASCHNVGSSGDKMDLSGNGTKIMGKFQPDSAGHMGKTLTGSELDALAAYVDGSTPAPTPDPVPTPDPIPVDGQAVFSDNCASCHNVGSAGDKMDLSGDGAKVMDKFQPDVAGHKGKTLTGSELDGLVAYVDGSTPAPTPDPVPVDGQTVFSDNCAACHNVGNDGSTMDLAAKGTLIATKFQPGSAGHMGRTLSAAEIDALAGYLDASTPAPTPDPVPTPDPGTDPSTPLDGPSLYAIECAGCHGDLAGTNVPGRTAAQIQAAIDGNVGGMGGIVLTAEQMQLIADALPAAPAPAADGETLYNNNCAGCHALADYDAAGFAPDLAATGSLLDAKLASGHGSGPYSTDETANLTAWVDSFTAPAPPTPTPDPTPVSGEALYNNNCAGCHALADYDAAGFAPDLAATGSLLDAKLASGHGGGPYSGDETANLTAWVDSFAAPAPPTPTPDPTPVSGETLYNNNCAGCHSLNGYDASGSAPDLASAGSRLGAKLDGGHAGGPYTAAETDALIGWVDGFTAPATEPTCGSCHALPPSGATYPNTTGAHTVHTKLPGVGTDCSVCHSNNRHLDDWVDIGILSTFDANSGAASDNPDGTASCVNVSCHGGNTTPDWVGGTINVNTQCTSCHSRGTSQYNSYNSGEHGKSAHARRACTDCHNTSKLAANHFSNLSTTAMEGPASSTVGGGSTRVSSYDPGNGSCTTSCHGSERW